MRSLAWLVASASLLACGGEASPLSTSSGTSGGTSAGGEDGAATGSTAASGGGSSQGGAPSASSGGGSTAGPTIYEEIDGLVAVEAEHFDTKDDSGTLRDFYLTTPQMDPMIMPDPDPPHADSASGMANLEGLPDTRVTHDDQLISGENFYPGGGQGPYLTYRVYFNNPGTYYLWLRAYSTGTEDNGAHAGIDGSWPASGERIQFCQGKNQWTWSSAQRDSGGNACGIPNTITLDVPSAGEHTISISMREDGFELDKWVMTNDATFVPMDAGPAEVIYMR
jgi:hypothetical protein